MSDDFQVICEAGRQAAQNIDAGRWIIGDLALLVEKEYRRDTIADFAREINIEKARVMEYRTVSGFWEKSVRAEILTDCPNISYSHMRVAMRFKELEAARAFVEECATNTWTVEQARLKILERCGKPVPAGRLVEGTAWITGQRGQIITLKFDDADLQPLQDSYLEGWAVRVAVYEGDKTMMRTNVAMLLGSGDRERRIR